MPNTDTMSHKGQEAIRQILTLLGDDAEREGLLDTPRRVQKSWSELFAGYTMDVKSLMTVFEDDSSDEMVLLRDIEFYSTCEHHMLPFTGVAHIAYIPNNRVIGVSKLARIMEVYSRRLQIQERIGRQVTTALMKFLQPKGAACIIEAQHLCMQARGVGKQNSVMVTSDLRGVFKDDPRTRSELMQLISRRA